MAAAQKLILNTGRQYPLVLQQAFTHENLDGTLQTLIARLPRNAVITAGSLQVVEAFDASGKIKFGTADDADQYGDIDVATVGAKQLTLTGVEVGTAELLAQGSTEFTKGAGVLYLTYVLTGRSNEVHPNPNTK